MKIYLVRHGADDNTVRGGWSNHPLTNKGIKQSLGLAEKLKASKCNAEIIYSSDLLRAKQTAEILANHLNLEIAYNQGFREVNNGDLAGMDNNLANKLYPDLFWKNLKWEQQYPNGESPKEFYERVKTAWDNLIKTDNESIILVTHGGVINVIMHIVNREEYSNKKHSYKVGNADYIEVNNWK